MRVLSLSYCFPNAANPSWGVFVLQRLAALARLVDLEVASPAALFPLWSRLRGVLPGPTETMRGLKVHRPGFFYFPGVFKNWDGRFYARGIRKWLGDYCRRVRPDILDAHFVWPDGVGAYYLAEELGIPFVITLRGKIYDCMESSSMRRQCGLALRHAAAVISVSGPMAELAAQLGAPRDKLFVIPNGVDKEFFRPRDVREARGELGLPTDGRLIVSIAHLKRTKGHGETVAALAKLPADVRLVIVGGEAVKGYRQELLGQVAALGLGDRVILAGRQPYGKMPVYFSAADLSVLASHREGCPNVVLESMACGRPVVAANVGAVPDLVIPGKNGLIVPARDADAVARAVAEALGRPWPAQDVRDSATVRPWDEVARQVHEVFLRVLGVRAVHAGKVHIRSDAGHSEMRSVGAEQCRRT